MPTAVMEQIEIERDTLGKVLKDNRLCVPVHQRNYRWEPEQITDLFTDLAGAIADKSSPEYFLGSIVVVKRPDGQLEVNDGQQRLATTAILLAAIRDHFKQVGDTTAEIIDSQFLSAVDRRTHVPTPKLTLNLNDNEFFIKRVLQSEAKTPAAPGSHRRISRAAQLAAEHVAAIVAPYSKPDALQQLHNWVDYIEGKARIIKVIVADERTAYIIFETMNDRGLQLTSVDLLKNRLYATANGRLQEIMANWQTMTGVIETLPKPEDAQLDYVRHVWISENGHIRGRFLYDRIKEKITNVQEAVTFSAKLAQNAVKYQALLNPASEMWRSHTPAARQQLSLLATYGVKQLRPMLLAALNKFSANEFVRLLDAAVVWTVRCAMCGVFGGSLEIHYNRAAKGITDGEIKTTAEAAKAMSTIIPDDERFRNGVATARITWEPLARYYLNVLQRTADGEKEAQYVPNDAPDVTLEHILPENPDASWNYISEADRKAFYARLGNLALLQSTPNSKLGNVSYDLKKPTLTASKFSLTQEAAQCNEPWGPATIAKRQEKLADLAVKAWAF